MTDPAPLAIEVKGLVKKFEDLTAVNGIDLSIPSGQCVGLLGPNGAGKTTTVEILEGLQKPTGGSVRILGRSWEQHAEEIRARIGIALQETHFYEKLTVEETVKLFRSFFPRGRPVEEAIARVKLEEKKRAYVVKLSGGQRQRLALAVALVSDPEVIFLDEPTTGLDPQSRRALWDVIESLKGQGRTVVLTTHYMEEAERLCDRVVIVDRGRIVADGTPAELIASIGGAQIVELRAAPTIDEAAFASVPGLVRATARNGDVVCSVDALHVSLPEILKVVAARGAKLERLITRHATLDDVFLSITGHSLRESEEGKS